MNEGKQETMTPAAEEAEVTSNQTQDTTNEELESSPELSGELETSIPKKFVGKSVADIAKSYTEVERKLGQISSERAQKDKELEDLRAKYQSLEQQYNGRLAQQSTDQPPQQEEETAVDPISLLDSEEWETDPRGVIKKALKAVSSAVPKIASSVVTSQTRRQSAQEFYTRQKSENPDFAEREPDMAALAKKYGHIVKPEFLQSPEFVDALYHAARGMRVQDYQSAALEKAKKSGDLVREEKRQAFSEGTSSQGDETVDFDSLSLEDQEAWLRKHRAG